MTRYDFKKGVEPKNKKLKKVKKGMKVSSSVRKENFGKSYI